MRDDMLFDPAVRPAFTPTGARPCPPAQACHFGPSSAPLSGWYHAAAVPAGSSLAVLICPPIGDEAIAVHRAMRQLARKLAAAGLATLRFDPAGTGDSADPPDMAEADQVSVWLQSIRTAAEALRAASGMRSVALVGVRNGSLIAAHAAFAMGEVAALVALVPVTNGSGYLRECRFRGSLLRQPVPADGAVMAGGHRYNQATVRRLDALDWRRGEPVDNGSPATALVIDWSERPAGAACAERLAAQGTLVAHEKYADLDRLAAMAHQSYFPPAVADRIVAWLAAQPGPVIRLSPPAPPDLSVLRTGPARLATACGELIEEHVRVGSAPALAGVVTRRADAMSGEGEGEDEGQSGGHGVLLLASGSERQIGAHRISAVFARERAARGDIVLRLDRAGIGDSEARPGGSENNPFEIAAVADVVAGIDFLRSEHGVRSCSVIGFCAGAFHGWRAVVAGLEVDRLVSVNPVAYTARDGRNADPRVAAFQVAVLADARRSLVDVQRWKQLLRGELRLRGIAAAMLGRVRAQWTNAARRAARLARRPMADDLAVDLGRVGRCGTRQHFIFSADEPGLALLRIQGGGVLKRLLRDGDVQIDHLAKADHSCTSEANRRSLRTALNQALDADPGARSSTARRGVLQSSSTLVARASTFSRSRP